MHLISSLCIQNGHIWRQQAEYLSYDKQNVCVALMYSNLIDFNYNFVDSFAEFRSRIYANFTVPWRAVNPK